MIPWRNVRRFLSKALKQPGYACGVFTKRLTASLYYTFGNGKSALPESVTFFLTHRCNLYCKMCGQWGEGGVTRKQSQHHVQEELPQEKIRAVIDEISHFKPSITLFGGEPLLYKGCLEIIRHIKQKGLHCLMITNGSLVASLAEELLEGGLDELNVSLDGDAALHDEIRGTSGLFNTIMQGLLRVRALKAERRRRTPLVNLQCTITRYNYQYLERLIAVASEAGADSLTFHNLIFIEEKTIAEQKAIDENLSCSSEEWRGFVFEPGIDSALLQQKKEQILKKKYPFAVDFYPNFTTLETASYYRDPCFHPGKGKARCLSPWLVGYVFPDGEVRPCLNCTYSFGSIKNRTFSDIWNSEGALRYRRLLKANHAFPVCARCTELYRY